MWNLGDLDVDQKLLLATEEFSQKLESDIEQNTLLSSPLSLRSSGVKHSPVVKPKEAGSPFQKVSIINSETYQTQTPIPPMQLETPNSSSPNNEGLVIVLNVVCSFIHTVRYPSSQLAGLELFSLFSKYLNSEIRLQRLVPYIISMLNKDSALVRATGLRTLTQVVNFL